MINLKMKMGLNRVKAIESHVSAGGCCNPSLKELVFKGSLRGSTPLLLACADGNLIVVKRIIEEWGVDPRAAATYHYQVVDGDMRSWESLEDATPLFVAALNGHDPVVRYLIEKGAEISAKTALSNGMFSGMTPLYGALTVLHHCYDAKRRITPSLREKKTSAVCFLLQSGAVPSDLPQNNMPAWKTPLCNNDATVITQLVNYGMSLTQRNPLNGETVLHHWAGCSTLHHSADQYTALRRATEEGSTLTVIKLLVEKGADLMALDDDGFTPILRVAHAFLARTNLEHLSIFDFLLENEAIDREAKIDALELMGALILSHSQNVHLFSNAFDYWRRALHLREMKRNGSEPIIKIAMKRKSGLAPEWVTSAELEHVMEHPSEYLIQSFLIGLRICSSKSCRAVCTFVDEVTQRYCPWMFLHGNFTATLNLLWAALEILSFQPKEERSTWSTSARIVKRQTVSVSLYYLQAPQLLKSADYIKSSLELILSSEQLQLSSNIYHQNTESDLNLLCLLFTQLADRPDLLIPETKELLVKLVRLERPAGTLLHPACKKINIAVYRSIIPLLLTYGVDPSIGDLDGNGPLHIVLAQYSNDSAIHEERVSIARLLLDKGAHLDRVNKRGQTAVDLWVEARSKFPGAPQFDRLPDWCYESIPKLMCLSSRVIRSHKIFYTAETLPINLHKFVEMH